MVYDGDEQCEMYIGAGSTLCLGTNMVHGVGFIGIVLGVFVLLCTNMVHGVGFIGIVLGVFILLCTNVVHGVGFVDVVLGVFILLCVLLLVQHSVCVSCVFSVGSESECFTTSAVRCSFVLQPVWG